MDRKTEYSTKRKASCELKDLYLNLGRFATHSCKIYQTLAIEEKTNKPFDSKFSQSIGNSALNLFHTTIWLASYLS